MNYRRNDRVGWLVGNRLFQNKLEALDYALQTNQTVSFSFFQRSFESFDWSREPSESWQELLLARAQQLRDQYPYLRLFYSGGVDSQTILNVFLKHQIPLNEIICYRYVPLGNVDHPVNDEINHVAIPFLKENEALLRKTKISILDVTPDRYERWLSGDWYKKKAFLDVLAPDPPDMEYLFPELFQKRDGADFFCHIQGGQKPRLSYVDGAFYAYFYDSHLMADLFGLYQENFYTSPSFPSLHIKQCHLLMKTMIQHGIDKLSPEDQTSPPNWLVNQSCRDPLFRSVDLGKTKGLYSAKTMKFIHDPRLEEYKWFRAYKGFLNTELRAEWFNHNDVYSNYKGISTPQRFVIGTHKER